MRLRKLFLSLLLAMALVTEAASLGWSAVNYDQKTILAYTLRVFFTLYTLSLSVRAINQIPHFESVVHISVLTLLATVSLFVTYILPIDDLSEVASDPVVLRGLGWTVLLINCIAFVVASTLPQSPQLHYPPERIYSDKILSPSTNVPQDNVCGITSMSVFPYVIYLR